MTCRLAQAAPLLLLCLASVAGCSGGHPPTTEPVSIGSGSSTGSGSAAVVEVPVDAGPPPPLDRDPPRLAARALALMTAIGDMFASVGEDCAAATAKLDQLRATYGDLLAANATMLATGRKDELKAAVAPRQTELDAAAAAVFASKTPGACAHDKAFARAFDLVLGGHE
jgi:hypothetical protein